MNEQHRLARRSGLRISFAGFLLATACGVAPPIAGTAPDGRQPDRAPVEVPRVPEPLRRAAGPAAPIAAAPGVPSVAAWTAPTTAIDVSSMTFQEPTTLEPYPNLYKTFGISVGGATYRNFDTSVRVDSDKLVGGAIDLEDTLGVDDASTVLRIDSFYGFNKYHNLDFSYYDIRRSGSRPIGRDIDFGNISIPSGSSVDTEFNTKILKLAYRYNFVADYRTVIGASVGFHTMQIETSLNAAAISISEEFKATVPLPVVGLHFEYALSPDWKLLASFELLQIDIGYARGFLSDQRLSIEHNPFDNFGWGIGYNGFDLEATVEGEGSLTGRLNYDFSGLMLFGRWYM